MLGELAVSRDKGPKVGLGTRSRQRIPAIGAEDSHVQVFQLFHMPAVKGRGLTTVQEG